MDGDIEVWMEMLLSLRRGKHGVKRYNMGYLRTRLVSFSRQIFTNCFMLIKLLN